MAPARCLLTIGRVDGWTAVFDAVAGGGGLKRDVVKFGAGCLELQGPQEVTMGGIRVANGTLALTDVVAQGVTNLTTASGTTLALRADRRAGNGLVLRGLVRGGPHGVRSLPITNHLSHPGGVSMF